MPRRVAGGPVCPARVEAREYAPPPPPPPPPHAGSRSSPKADKRASPRRAAAAAVGGHAAQPSDSLDSLECALAAARTLHSPCTRAPPSAAPSAPRQHAALRSALSTAAAPCSGTRAHSTHRMLPSQTDQVRGTDGQRCTPRTANAEQAIQRGDGLLTASSCLSTIYLHSHGCLSRSTRTQATCQLLYSQSVAIPAMRCRRRVALHCFPPSSFNPSMLNGSNARPWVVGVSGVCCP